MTLPVPCPPIVAFSITWGVSSRRMSRVARMYLKYKRFQLSLLCPLVQTTLVVLAVIPLGWVLTYE